MKKIVVFALVLIGCKGHIAWVSNKEEAKQETKIVVNNLKPELGGVKFSFDDGPDLAKTPKILDSLKKYNLQATFFVEGINLVGESEMAKERRNLLNRMVSEGHIIGNHTYDHKDLCRQSIEQASWELTETNKLISASVENGYKTELMRPPYGKKCQQLKKLLNKHNLTPIYWDIDVREYERSKKTGQYKTKEEVLASFIEQYVILHNERGMSHMMLILHDTKKVSVEALPLILDYLSRVN